MPRKLSISRSKSFAVAITRRAIRAKKLVYIAKANKPIKYKLGKSHIAYIGTTKEGANRIAESAAKKAREFLIKHGIKKLEFFVITCGARKRIETWKKLESALILAFRSSFGEPPKGNSHGVKLKWKDEKEYFKTSALEKTIKLYS